MNNQKLNFAILAIGKRDKLPFLQPKGHIGTYFADLLLPCTDTGIKVQSVLAFTNCGRWSFDNLKKAFIVLRSVRVVRFSKELVGQVAQDGTACLIPVHQIVLGLVLHHVDR